MKDQVKREFAVTNKLRPIYPSSSPHPPFSGHASHTGFAAPNSGGGGGSGSLNSSTESTAPVTYQDVQTDDFINYNVDDDEDEESYDEEEYFNSFPPGYRFKPHDEELVVYYLKKKIFNEDLPRNRIKEVELYKYNPETLAAKYKANGEDEWYFFTPRDRKYPNGDRPNRAAGDGFWKATGADKAIKFKGKKVGLKKSLVFYRGKPPRGEKTDWIMYEFKLIGAPKRTKVSQTDMKLDDWVLCKIRKKEKRKDKSDKAASASVSASASGSQAPSIEPSLPSENVSAASSCHPIIAGATCVPIITGVTDDSGYFYYNHNGISESTHVSFDQASAYAQQSFNLAGYNNLVPWIDNTASSRIPYHHAIMQTSYDHILHDPQMQSIESIGFITDELDEFLHNMPGEKDSKNS
ncbi:NAC domain-containing protein 1-like [Euphorbia lathyris]|uniref:NAC domain-containing protein 1-like n=1 Tax=Euphorbia lathyris TaxID=212925 RepID=UPI003313EF5D